MHSRESAQAEPDSRKKDRPKKKGCIWLYAQVVVMSVLYRLVYVYLYLVTDCIGVSCNLFLKPAPPSYPWS